MDQLDVSPQPFEESRFIKIIDSVIAELQNIKCQHAIALRSYRVAEEDLRECKKAHNETAAKATQQILALKDKLKRLE